MLDFLTGLYAISDHLPFAWSCFFAFPLAAFLGTAVVESGCGCGKTTAVSVLRIISSNCAAAAEGAFLALNASSVSAVSSSVGVDSPGTSGDVVVLVAVSGVVGLPD